MPRRTHRTYRAATRIALLAPFFACILVWLGCSGEQSFSPMSYQDESPQLVGPVQSKEAQLASLWLSGELYAPGQLSDQIAREVSLIRNRWQDSIPAVEIAFTAPWEAGKLILGFDRTAYGSIQQGTYHAWDSLNLALDIDTVNLTIPEFRYLNLEFTAPLNPWMLVEAYRDLPGATFAIPNYYVGDSPLLLMWRYDDKIAYFFRDAWGDCPSGCTEEEYWMFTVTDGNADFLGYYPNRLQMHPVWRARLDSAWAHYQNQPALAAAAKLMAAHY